MDQTEMSNIKFDDIQELLSRKVDKDDFREDISKKLNKKDFEMNTRCFDLLHKQLKSVSGLLI